MKKNIIAVIALTTIWGTALNGQTSTGGNKAKSYVGDINQIFPPAPTSNNLMKFEEVPVSYYSGIPDISIPLFNIPTIHSKVPISIQLKYHPLSAKPDDKAGETGLGWSIIAGGTISRTIRGGGVDEKDRVIESSSPPKSKFGIYNHTYNPTYKLLNNEPVNMDDYSFFAGLGRYDTEYDLFQYNFMGYSGRFYIVKDAAGNYKAEKLDKNNLQIRFDNDPTGVVSSFTIINDIGVKYIFSPMERSQKSINNIKTGLTTGTSDIDGNLEIDNYWSSFHLTKITDQNNVALALFTYDLSSEVKFQEPTTKTIRNARNVNYIPGPGTTGNPDGNMPGAIESQTIYNTTNTKLLTSIEIIGKGNINLNYEKGRQDSNYIQPAELYKLKSVQSNFLGQNAAQYVERYTFDYGYSDTSYQADNSISTLKKMVLTKITKTSPNDQNEEYILDYYKSQLQLSKDNWGYYQGNPTDITNDVIKSITYPTKGKVVFDFGSNDYSHFYGGAAMQAVTGYWTRQENEASIHFGAFDGAKQSFFTINSPQTVKIHSMIGNLIYYNWIFKIYKKTGTNTFVEVHQKGDGNQTCNVPQPPACEVSTVNPDGVIISDYTANIYLEPGTYFASLEGSYYPSIQEDITDTFSATTAEDVFVNETKKNGGGLRINSIKYFDTTSITPAKEFVYDYRDIEAPQKSSGSLVFPEPITNYYDSYTYRNKVDGSDIFYKADFEIKTNYNIIPVEKTQGSDVGYKYVKVKQIAKGANNSITDNGSTLYQFRSPLDFPNQGSLALQPPIISIPNLDYLRGQLSSEKKYNSSGQILSEVKADYSVTEIEKNDGIKLLDNFYRNSIGQYFIYNTYQELLAQAGVSVQLTTPYKNYEKFGIALPSKKIETSYFYQNGIQSSVTNTTNNAYNAFDYPSLETQLFPDGSSSTTSYLYATDKNNQLMIERNMISIPLETKIQQTSDNITKVTSKEETIYPTTLPNAATGNLVLPLSEYSYDILNSAISSKDVAYEKYDENGNILQYREKDGTPVSIVWGYNKTRPIAKVVGSLYSQVEGTISTIVNKSNEDAADPTKESELLLALDAFQPVGLTTKYTYDPLVGVTTITPPSGVRELYVYDTAKRLKQIQVRERDNAGTYSYKVVKEFKYNYK